MMVIFINILSNPSAKYILCNQKPIKVKSGSVFRGILNLALILMWFCYLYPGVIRPFFEYCGLVFNSVHQLTIHVG